MPPRRPRFQVLPRITGFTPAAVVGASATVVTVNGFNLKVEATTPTVKIGAFVVPPASITSSATQLMFPVPLAAVTGKIMVTTVDGTATSAADLVVVLPPKPTSFVPALAAVGTEIVINGTALAGATMVTFSGACRMVTPTAVTATSLPRGGPGAGAVTGPVNVIDPAGDASTTASFKPCCRGSRGSRRRRSWARAQRW